MLPEAVWNLEDRNKKHHNESANKGAISGRSTFLRDAEVYKPVVNKFNMLFYKQPFHQAK